MGARQVNLLREGMGLVNLLSISNKMNNHS